MPIIPRIHRVLDGDVLKVVDEVIMVNPVVGVIIVLIGLSGVISQGVIAAGKQYMEAGVGAIVGRVSSEDVSLGLRELDARARKTS
jgi:hypothetical protein